MSTEHEMISVDSVKPPDFLRGLEDVAWFMGVFSAAGNVRSNALRFNSVNPEVINLISSVGQYVLNLKPRLEQRIKKNALQYTLNFNSRKLAPLFGDLRQENWAQTIASEHTWILSEDSFIKSFLSGYFDVRGWVSSPRFKNHELIFHTTQQSALEALETLLGKLEISNFYRKKNNKTSSGFHGLAISGYENVHKVALLLSPKLSEKNHRIELYQLPPYRYYTGDLRRLEAYEQVIVLHEQGITNIVELRDHPQLQGYKLSYSLIADWVQRKKSPYNHRVAYKLNHSHTRQLQLQILLAEKDEFRRFNGHYTFPPLAAELISRFDLTEISNVELIQLAQAVYEGLYVSEQIDSCVERILQKLDSKSLYLKPTDRSYICTNIEALKSMKEKLWSAVAPQDFMDQLEYIDDEYYNLSTQISTRLNRYVIANGVRSG